MLWLCFIFIFHCLQQILGHGTRDVMALFYIYFSLSSTDIGRRYLRCYGSVLHLFFIVLNRYWETVLEMLWPRFEMIVQTNSQSIRQCDPSRLGDIDVRPHYVSSIII